MPQREMNEASTRTQVGIVGVGPAGLLIGTLLVQAGIDCIMVERHSRDFLEQRTRAGLIEHWVVAFLRRHGLADRLLRERMTHARFLSREPGTGGLSSCTDYFGHRLDVIAVLAYLKSTYFFGFTLESLTFFGVSMEYFGVSEELFRDFVLISFRSYGGILRTTAGDHQGPPFPAPPPSPLLMLMGFS